LARAGAASRDRAVPNGGPPTELVVALAAAIVVLALAHSAWLALREAWRRHQLRARCARAARGEARAEGMLVRRGYAILGRQAAGSWIVRVDGRDVRVDVRADYVVERGGRRFVAEVKTGRVAPHIESSATRRQLLEYRVALDVEGVLLVDAEADAVREVVFPLPEPAAERWGARLATAVALAVGVALGALWAEPLRAAAVALAEGARAR
jgi:hypothetical protein